MINWEKNSWKVLFLFLLPLIPMLWQLVHVLTYTVGGLGLTVFLVLIYLTGIIQGYLLFLINKKVSIIETVAIGILSYEFAMIFYYALKGLALSGYGTSLDNNSVLFSGLGGGLLVAFFAGLTNPLMGYFLARWINK